MPEYKTTVKFERQFIITAKNATEANEKLGDLVRQVEWDADVTNDDGVEEFEDESVNCPKCKGDGVVIEAGEEIECDGCNCECTIEFEEAQKRGIVP